MSNPTVYIFYAQENKIEAELLSADFQKAKLSCITAMANSEKVQQLESNSNATALLLVSDNFLKSIDLTEQLEQLLSAAFQSQVVTVLTHGRRTNNKGTALQEVYPTKIKTLNNVMFYRDFWYEKWISLRKAAKQASGENQAELNRQKDIAKKMSVGSISTYIRQINNNTQLDWDALCADNYQSFFDLIGLNTDQIPADFERQELPSELEQEPAEQSSIELANESLSQEADSIDIDINEDSKLIEQQEQQLEIENLPNEDKEAAKNIEVRQDELPVVEETTSNNIDHSEDETALKTTDAENMFIEAATFTEAGNFEAAKEVYLRMLQKDPYNGQALMWLSRLLAAHFPEEVQAAANAYRKSIMVNDENADLYYEYGMLQKEQLQAYSRAADAFNSALDIDSMYEEAYLGLAYCQKEMGMEVQAKANYLQACILHSERFETKENDQHFGVVRLVEESNEEEEEALIIPPNPNADTVVLVTGASAGIGKSIAQQFIMNGYKVIITARRKERLERFKKEMEANYQQANILCLPFDICNIEAVKSALECLSEPWSNIDILINNAGLAKGFAPVQEGNIDHWEAMINTNVKGLLYMSRMITPGMVARKKGHVVNLSSVAGTQVYSGGGAYCATKAAVDSLTRSMRLDLYKHNIKVSSISPGHVDATEFASVRYDEPNKSDIYKDFKPLCAQDVAETVYYVVSRPQHVNIQDVLIFGTQQASARDVNRSGRNDS